MEEKKVKKEETDVKGKTTAESKEAEVKGKVTVENKGVKGKITIEKKKDNKNVMLVSAIIGIVLIAFIATIIFLLSYMKTPNYAVKKSFDSLRRGDVSSVNENMPYDELMNSLLEKANAREEMSNLDKTCFEKFKYSIKNTTINGDKAIVTIATTNKNFRNALTKWSQSIYQKFISGEEISNDQGELLLINCLADESIGTMSVTEDITLNKIDGKWKIQVDDKLENAVFPGLNDIANSSVDSIINE